MPLVDTSARRVPLQPPSTRASVGSRSTAKSASAMSSGRCCSTWSSPLYCRVDLLGLVEHERDVAAGLGHLVGDPQHHGDAALHVDGAPAPEHLSPGGADPTGRQVHRVGGQRHGVDVAGEHHALVTPEVGAGHDGVADAGHLEVREVAQRGLHGIRQRAFVEAHRLDVAHRGGERGDVGGEVEGGGRRRHTGQRSDRAAPSTLVGMTRTAWGHALLTLTDGGTVLDAWFPSPALGAPGGAGELAAPAGLEALAGRDEARGVTREVRLVTADLDTPPTDAADGWLRLHLLSHRLGRAELGLARRPVRRAHQRRVDLPGAVRRGRLRADPGADAGARAPCRCSASTSSPG